MLLDVLRLIVNKDKGNKSLYSILWGRGDYSPLPFYRREGLALSLLYPLLKCWLIITAIPNMFSDFRACLWSALGLKRLEAQAIRAALAVLGVIRGRFNSHD